MKMNTDKGWLLTKAKQEDGCVVSVGGLVEDLLGADQASSDVTPMRHAFSRFLQLARRDRKLTISQFAEKVDVDLAELYKLETDERCTPAVRTVYKIAEFLRVPQQRLMTLAGLVTVKDVQFQNAALKFAARSEPVESLSPEEHAALEDYVKYLCER